MLSKYIPRLHRPNFELEVPLEHTSHVFDKGVLIGDSYPPLVYSLPTPGYPSPPLSYSLLSLGYPPLFNMCYPTQSPSMLPLSYLFLKPYSVHPNLPRTNIYTP